jgi:hypothetical protein
MRLLIVKFCDFGMGSVRNSDEITKSQNPEIKKYTCYVKELLPSCP